MAITCYFASPKMKAPPVRRVRKRPSAKAKSFFNRRGEAGSFFTAGDFAAHSPPVMEAGLGQADVARPALNRHPPGRGEPLPEAVRCYFEQRTGADLRSVRVHHDPEAIASASALRAQAYTLGENIVFNRDKYAPHTEAGRELLSHELIHVLQQRQIPSALQRVQRLPEEPEEQKEPPAPAAPQAAAAATAGQEAAAPREAGPAKAQEDAAASQAEAVAEPMSLPDFSTFGKPTTHTDFVNLVTFKGETEATFDGGVGQTKNLKAVPAKGCEGCPDSECFSVTGTLEITYHVSTTVTLPEVPSGLTPCQEKRVREAIDTKIAPHEDQHVSAFGTYNGTVKLPINYKGCKEGLADFVQAMHDKDAAAREATARAKSAALDPFHVNVDLDCEEPPPKK